MTIEELLQDDGRVVRPKDTDDQHAEPCSGGCACYLEGMAYGIGLGANLGLITTIEHLSNLLVEDTK